MAVITLNTTAGQDTVLARLFIKMNADRAAQTPPPTPYVDVQDMVRDILKNAVISYNQNQVSEDLVAINAAYAAGNTASDGDQDCGGCRMKRCDEVIIQLIVREYNDAGEPVGEQTSQPAKIFRATSPDIWAAVDSTMATE